MSGIYQMGIARDRAIQANILLKFSNQIINKCFLLVLHPNRSSRQQINGHACYIRVVNLRILYVDVFCMPLKSYTSPIQCMCALILFYKLVSIPYSHIAICVYEACVQYNAYMVNPNSCLWWVGGVRHRHGWIGIVEHTRFQYTPPTRQRDDSFTKIDFEHIL